MLLHKTALQRWIDNEDDDADDDDDDDDGGGVGGGGGDYANDVVAQDC